MQPLYQREFTIGRHQNAKPPYARDRQCGGLSRRPSNLIGWKQAPHLPRVLV